MQAAGFVLVGGHSSRMGCDKALLPYNSRSLLGDVAIKLAAVAGSVALVGESIAQPKYAGLEFDCLPDSRPGLGPLAGIETALESRRGELNLILACDMPGLEIKGLQQLLAKAQETGTLCLVARDADNTVHPLYAVYRSACLPMVRNALNRGRLKLMDLLIDLNASMFQVDRPIWNLNTPEQWAAWRHKKNTIGTAHAN